jgi:uncharacterized protein (TIGR02145 family)
MKPLSIALFILTIMLIHSCKKDNTSPSVTIGTINVLSYTTATVEVTVTDDGGAPILSKGVCWNTTGNPTIADSKTNEGEGSEAFVSHITGLAPTTFYYVRAYATNSVGTAYGYEVNFGTPHPVVPDVKSAEITSITETTAVSGGTVTSDYGDPVTEKGVCWGTSPDPTTADNKTIGNGTGSFVSNLTGLQVNTTYYVRAYAINSAGTGYGKSVSFKTQFGSKITFNPALSYGSLSDIDGNTYKVITIGTQTWMAENLQTTKYNDGTPIPLVTDGKAWAGLTTPGYSWYNNNEQVFKKLYGALYNWYAVNTGKLCPAGWHVSTNTEWATLITYLGGSTVAGGKLKEAGTSHWDAPNTNATNESGFTALPGGGRSVYFVGTDVSEHYGDYIRICAEGLWWTYTGTNKAIYQNMYSEANGVVTGEDATEGVGFSVRCVKD